MRALAPLLVFLTLSAAGCEALFDPCFGPAQRVRDLRVLGVRADPPEVVFEPAAASLPPVRVSILVADPQTSDPVTVTGLLCPETKDNRCPEGSPSFGPVTGPAGSVTLVANVPRALLDAVLAADPLQGYGGLRVQADLTVRSSFRRSVQASKLLIFTPATPGYLPNHGFEVEGIWLTHSRGETEFVGPRDILRALVPEVIGMRPSLIGPDGSPLAGEEYEVVDLAGTRAHLREHISYSFYTTVHARFLSDTAVEPSPGEAQADLVRFQPTLAAGGTLYIVARDGRGGVAWFTAQWLAQDLREGRKPNLELECE